MGAPGRGDDPPDQFTQTFNASVLFILISVKLTIVNLGVTKRKWSEMLKKKKEQSAVRNGFIPFYNEVKCVKVGGI